MRPIKVLVVDDSFTMRLLISDILNSDPRITVIDTAKTGEEAIDRIMKCKPDCVTLDLVMPGMDGLTTLKTIMTKYPTPVIILSGSDRSKSELASTCISHGAASFISKPSGELSFDIDYVRTKLIEEVKGVTKDKEGYKKNHCAGLEKRKHRGGCHKNQKIVVIGASTGGPETILELLSSFPADFPSPILVAQHMPREFYLDNFVKRLNQNSWMEVRIIEDYDPILEGTIYCIPNGAQVIFEEKAEGKIFRLKREPESELESEQEFFEFVPSIDATMITASKLYKERSIGIILTGMGTDGAEGMRHIKEYGGRTIVQDETAFLDGMPKAVLKLGLADFVLPIDLIPEKVTAWVLE